MQIAKVSNFNNFTNSDTKNLLKNNQNKKYQNGFIPNFRGRDFLDLTPKAIFAKINKTIIDKKNYLGEGCEGIVFGIKDSNYCIKLPMDIYVSGQKIKVQNIKAPLTKQDVVNHVVVKLKDNISIMKKIVGTPVWNMNMTEEQAKNISSQVAQMPISTFHSFLEQISYAHKQGMVFDNLNENVIVNAKKQKITAIDFTYNDDVFHESIEPLRYMFESLTNDYSTKEEKKTIFKKVLFASLREFYPRKKPCLDINDFDISEFIYLATSTKLIKKNKKIDLLILKLYELKEANIQTPRKNNKELIQTINDIKTYISKEK